MKASTLCLLGIASCGGSSGSTTPSTEAGTAVDGAVDSAVSSDAQGSNGDAGGSSKEGIIVLSSWDYTLSSTQKVGMAASAGFLDYEGAALASPACPKTTDGACAIEDCPASDAGLPLPTSTASAGTLQITGGTMPVSLVPSGTSYPPVQGTSRLWNGGESIHVTAAGAEVPAFDIGLTAPSYVTVTAPAWPALGSNLTIDRTQPLTLSWSGGQDGTVEVQLRVSGARQVGVVCMFPAASGSGSIPVTALAKFPVATTGASLSVDCITDKNTTAGAWSVLVRADAKARTTAGDGVTGAVIP
jgi:hypothetical protein